MPKKGYRTITVPESQYRTMESLKIGDESMSTVLQRLVEQPYTWQRFLKDLARLGR